MIRRGDIFEGTNIREYSDGLNQPGDNNGDCEINGLDVVYLVNYFKGYITNLPLNIYIADVNGSCVVNGLDVTYYMSYLKGGPPLLDGNCP